MKTYKIIGYGAGNDEVCQVVDEEGNEYCRKSLPVQENERYEKQDEAKFSIPKPYQSAFA
ncbi:MAG: hypothetical protein HY036_10285 [Nitrospirae bacterium]|nr:hypothetical protein [Nitrospirota bacterium]